MDLRKRVKELALEAHKEAEKYGNTDRHAFMVGYIGMHAASLENILHDVYDQLPDAARIKFRSLITPTSTEESP